VAKNAPVVDGVCRLERRQDCLNESEVVTHTRHELAHAADTYARVPGCVHAFGEYGDESLLARDGIESRQLANAFGGSVVPVMHEHDGRR
jgi:hypothetical protein